MIGIPYATAFVDDDGTYGVVCPICDLRIVVPEPLSEDHATKGASLAYAIHYETNHESKVHAHPQFDADYCPICGTDLDLATGRRRKDG